MKNFFKARIAPLFGIIALIAVIVFTMVGCASFVPPNYYNLGDVSEEDCALIIVSRTGGNIAYYSHSSYVSIDGQGDYTTWKTNRVPFAGDGDAIVRVTPGTHTFTGKVLRTTSDQQGVPISITYDVQAGKGYGFSFENVPNNTRAVKLIMYEYNLDENGKFGLWPTMVAEETGLIL